MKFKKKVISALLAALLLLPMAALGDTAQPEIKYYDLADGELVEKSIPNAAVASYVTVTSGTTAFEDGAWYVVKGCVTVESRIENRGNAHLILTDGSSLTVKGGIHNPPGKELSVYGQTNGTGNLLIEGVAENAAGIGGSAWEGGGNVSINGGTVNVTGGANSAGIGGGFIGAGGNVAINGGIVSAQAGAAEGRQGNPAGIGRGQDRAVNPGPEGELRFGSIKPVTVRGNGSDVAIKTLAADHQKYTSVYVEYKKAGYTVRHLKQKEVLKDAYELIDTETPIWFVNNPTKAVAKDIPGYTPSFKQATVTADGNTVVEIKYNLIYYTITFDMNGHGAAVGPISAVPGAAVEEPEKPAAKGYLFEGWYTEAECTNPYTFTKMPSGDLTLYAKWAADPAKREDVSYVDESGITKTVSCIILSEDQENYAFEEGEWYAVKGSITIDNRADDRASGGDPAHLILTDGCSLTAKGGINVGSGKGLSIYGQEAGTGKLTAKVESGSAIGGGGRITINGGTIEATGGADRATSGVYGGPGIGGNNSDVVINGGTVTAAGGSGTNGGAGIGAGAWDAKGGSVTINGGTVTATGGDGTRVVNGGMGIGAANGSVTIGGGEITATGGTGKTGIGGTLAFGSDPAVLKAGANKEGASDVEPGEYLSDHADYPYAYLKYNQYLIIEGANQTILTTAASARFVSNAPFEKFLRVEVDGRGLSAAYYTARSGSTAITFTRSYIDTLELGAHTLRIVSSDGSASTGFTVVYAPAGAPVISPADAYVNEGQQATFKVKTPDKRLTYQWYIDRNDERGWKELEGATDTSYTTSKAEQKNDGYRYKCIAKGPDDYSAESNIAVLHIGSFPVPPTGDGSRPLLWTALALLSGAALLRAGRKRRLSR